MTEDELKDRQFRLYIRWTEALDCGTIVTDIITKNQEATAFDCLSALIKRRESLETKIKEVETEYNESIIKDVIT